MTRFKTPMMLCAAATLPLGLGACAENYAVEGAAVGAAAGVLVGETTRADTATAAAIGAAAGAAAGYFLDKDNRCDGYDSRGRLDDDCRGLPGYPPR